MAEYRREHCRKHGLASRDSVSAGVASRMESALASTHAEDSDPGMAEFHAMARAAERSVKSRRDEIGAAPAVDASAGDVSQVEAVVPAPAVADDALLRLNTQQLAAVNLSRGSANIFICGGGGVGKSETVTAMINDSKKVNAVMGPHHSSLSIITRKCKNTLSPEVFAKQRFMTVNKGTGVYVGDDWDVQSIMANYENEGRSGFHDTVTAERSR